MDGNISEEAINRKMEERGSKDLKDVIRIILSSPLKDDGPVVHADGDISLLKLSKKNTDVMTRVVMSLAKDAAKGNVKPAELLFKYGGYEPVKEQNINVNTPNIIDDMTCRANPVVSAIIESDEEEEAEDD